MKATRISVTLLAISLGPLCLNGYCLNTQSTLEHQSEVAAPSTKRVIAVEPDSSPDSATATLKQRLDRLIEQLEDQRKQLCIPGLAIAVVKDGEIILARGLGLADVEKEKPVTPETLFPIGSTTKAFTATLIGMLVDEGKMNWDDPVTEHIPFFKLGIDSDNEDAVVTIRDLLAHRTGFTRMTLLFASENLSRLEVLRAATKAKPMEGFRKRFIYNNVMYLAAGVAAGNAADSDWDTLTNNRLLHPLGMNRTTPSIQPFLGDDRLARGYLWSAEEQSFKRQKERINDAIAPAGGILSNVLDMARWVRFQLDGGQCGSRRLISEDQFQETRTSQIEISDGVSYGLGWILRTWEGQPVIEHSGGTRGYAAQVALLPKSNLGFVLQMNVTASPLLQRSVNMVWEALLGEQKQTAAEIASDAYGEYLGKYLPTHREAEFTVAEQNGRLTLKLPPNPTTFELEAPDKEGKWYFALSNQMAVSFVRNKAGEVIVMRIHQGPKEYECVRAGVELPPEIDLSELDRHLGSYRSNTSGTTVNVILQNNRLAIDVPGRTVFELQPPNEEGSWVFRINSTSSVTFNQAQEGRIVSITFRQANVPDVEMTRVETGEAQPMLEEILALRRPEHRKAMLEKWGTFRLTGTMRHIHSGVGGSVELYANSPDRFFTETDYGPFGLDRLVVNGKRAWSEKPGSPGEKLYGTFFERARRSHPAAIFGDWRDFFKTIRVLRNAEMDGRPVFVIELAGGAAPDVIVAVDPETGDTLKAETNLKDPSFTVSVPIETRYEDYREVEGLRIPFRIVTTTEVSGRSIIQFDEFAVRLEIGEGFFARSRFIQIKKNATDI